MNFHENCLHFEYEANLNCEKIRKLSQQMQVNNLNKQKNLNFVFRDTAIIVISLNDKSF